MIFFLSAAVAIWFIGRAMRIPPAGRLPMIGLLYIGILSLFVIAPGEAGVRAILGGSLSEWAMLGVLTAVVWVYSVGLGRLRARAAAGEAARMPRAKTDGALNDVELERYARHIIMREIGGTGQRRLKSSRVLVIGAGGLGSPALLYLAGAGVGTIGVIDDDTVDVANLQRQIIHTDDALDMPKVFSAERAMRALNPFITVRPYQRRLTEEIAHTLFDDYDYVLDGTDNFATRRVANAAAVARGIPLISGAITQWEGQVAVFDPASGGPCYACVFPEDPAPHLAPSCAEAGVAGPLPGVIGAMMAMEAVKLITDAGQPLRNEMLIYDGLWGETRKIAIKRNPDCPVCGGTR